MANQLMLSFVRLGYPDHVLLTPEPNIWDDLPTDDDLWDNPVIITSTVRLTGTDVFSLKMKTTARHCHPYMKKNLGDLLFWLKGLIF